MYIPEDFTFLNGQSRLSQRKLKAMDGIDYSMLASYFQKSIEVYLYPQDMEDWETRNLHFYWNVTDFREDSLDI